MRFIEFPQNELIFYNLSYLALLINRDGEKINQRKLAKLKALVDPRLATNPQRADFSKKIDFLRKYGRFKASVIPGRFCSLF
jgi:hypothetical protein